MTQFNMKIQCYPLGELQANCYFIVNDKDCIIVDPGDSADFITEKISRENLKVRALVATHGHFDHVMAVGELQVILRVPFYISSKDAFLLKRVEETAKYFLGHTPEVIPIKDSLDISKGTFHISPFTFEVIETPGHTPGSICLYAKEDGMIFTGDTLFKNGIGRYDFSYSDKKQLFHSLLTLTQLPGETIIYPGHGDSSFIDEEKVMIDAL